MIKIENTTRTRLEKESYNLLKKLDSNEFKVWSDYQRHIFRMISTQYAKKF